MIGRGNFLRDSLAAAQFSVRQEVFQAVIVDVVGYKASVRRPNSTQQEGPYQCLGVPPPVGSIAIVHQVGRSFIILTHQGHQAFSGPGLVSSDYTAVSSDVFLIADPTASDVRISLSSLFPPGAEITIKRELDGTGNSVFIDVAGAQIEGLSEIELATEGESVVLRKGETNWYIVAGYP